MSGKKCNNCGKSENKPLYVSYAVFESTMTRQHIILKRLISVIILLVVLFVGSNCTWLWYESQFETVHETTTETYDVDQDTTNGNNNCIIKDGEINNGTPTR